MIPLLRAGVLSLKKLWLSGVAFFACVMDSPCLPTTCILHLAILLCSLCCAGAGNHRCIWFSLMVSTCHRTLISSRTQNLTICILHSKAIFRIWPKLRTIPHLQSEIIATFLWRSGPPGRMHHSLVMDVPSLSPQHAFSIWKLSIAPFGMPVCVITVVLFLTLSLNS